ncbi:aminotransferase-like domain-containing protein [Mesoterricola sediminis]|uniref:GntR family transcriptional regulator n=1 Tax=Mesoterricola sediminis TaxID=2927980 RepID=A0AA48H712_9BACT|nr:PLP-dependent aminotransferase family protein [Mesoterricola sediminis]BDU78541.1 GntR family transcriptional regulator [Mesoterricola sediminis]
MRPRDLLLQIPAGSGTLYARVADAVRAAILDGRLGPGTLLPGTRALSEMLGVNRRTVVIGLQRLEAEGWIVTEPYKGAVVADELPSGARAAPKAPGPCTQLGFDLPSLMRPVSTSQTGALLLADGAPDPRLAPGEAISRGYQRAMARHGAAMLQGRDPLGDPLLREQIAAWISERHGVAVDADRILLTRGSRSAISLLAHALFQQGETVLVETPGNRSAWDVFQAGAQMTIQGIPPRDGALDVEGIDRRCRAERIRLLYLTARRQFPTGATLAQDRAEALLKVAAAHRVAILEDDYDAEITFGDRRAAPLLALDREGLVIHLGSLSRLIAPGLRIAFLVVPAPLAPFLANVKQHLEEQGDAALEWAIGDLIRDGELSRHLRRTRRIFEHRRDILADLLRVRLGGDLTFELPTGGMGLWLKVREGLDADAWVHAARVQGLRLNPPAWFSLDEPLPCFRMGFAQADEAELRLAVDRLVQARKSLD